MCFFVRQCSADLHKLSDSSLADVFSFVSAPGVKWWNSKERMVSISMAYLLYDNYRKSYIRAKELCESIAERKSMLFAKTQPHSAQLDLQRVCQGQRPNVLDNYVIDLDRSKIDEQLHEAQAILMDRKYLLQMAERHLKSSQDLKDIVYYHKYVQGRKPEWISKMYDCSVRHIYRIIGEINQSIQENLPDTSALFN